MRSWNTENIARLHPISNEGRRSAVFPYSTSARVITILELMLMSINHSIKFTKINLLFPSSKEVIRSRTAGYSFPISIMASRMPLHLVIKLSWLFLYRSPNSILTCGKKNVSHLSMIEDIYYSSRQQITK